MNLRSTPMFLVAAAAVLVASGCGAPEPTHLSDAGLEDTYVAVVHRGHSEVLELADDGTFIYRKGVCEEAGLGAEGEVLGAGEWMLVRDRLELSGEGWTAVFVQDSTRVAVPGRSDTIGSLRWVGSSEGSPFNAVELVSMRQFENFVRPPEGSGSEGG